MRIPPVSGPNFQSPQKDPIVEKFNDLWNAWFNDPTPETAHKLLEFMKTNHDALAEIAKIREQLLPHPDISFEDSFDSAIRTLKAWVDHGCDSGATAAPSEFITNMAKWINS